MSEMRLHAPKGNQLYLNADERAAFLTEQAVTHDFPSSATGHYPL